MSNVRPASPVVARQAWRRHEVALVLESAARTAKLERPKTAADAARRTRVQVAEGPRTCCTAEWSASRTYTPVQALHAVTPSPHPND